MGDPSDGGAAAGGAAKGPALQDGAAAESAMAAWERFVTGLADAGAVVTGELGAQDERELAEGYRHVTRVLSIALEMLLEKGDRARPEFTRWMDHHRRILGDNPETIYDAAYLDPSLTYQIHGHRGTCTYLGVVVYGTGEGGARRIVGHLDDTDLAVIQDGAFEVWLAPAGSQAVPVGADVITLEDDATDVMVRQYFDDRGVEEEATYTIEAVPDPGPPPPLTPQMLASRLDEVTAFVGNILEVETTLSALMATATPSRLRFGDEYVDEHGEPTPPPIDPQVVQRAMPSPAIQYSGSWVDHLEEHEALVVEGVVPACRYWSVQLLSRWMESGDWHHHPVFLVGEQLVTGDDGRFRVVVSQRDPGVDNWVATTGMGSFNVVVRAIGASEPMQITYTRAPLAEL
ncbi:MAG: DUF1214 domain-containing protein [Actinobacteria bacterium]|nr:DUF1214 domain-containing protein [Actinomycetota bacterium]